MAGAYEIVQHLLEGEDCLCHTRQGQLLRTPFAIERRQVVLCEECWEQLRDGIAVLRQGRERRVLIEAHAQELAAARAETAEARTDRDRVRAEFEQARDAHTNREASWLADQDAIRGLQKRNRELEERLAEEETPTAA